jgi:hypothetical protein
MIEVKDAVKCAFQSLEYLFAEESISNPLLEEVELSEDETQWFITLGFNVKKETPKNFLEALDTSAKNLRKYKLFKIDAETGEFISMQILEVSAIY